MTAALALVVAGWTTVVGAPPRPTPSRRRKSCTRRPPTTRRWPFSTVSRARRRSAETTSIAEYRVYCLLALDRRDEARKDIEGILHDDRSPPSDDQLATHPECVSRRAAPVAAEDRDGTVHDRQGVVQAQRSQAGPQFDSVLTLLDDPDVQASPALSDLRTVVTAFRDLTKAMAAQTPAPTVARPLDAGGSSSQAPTPAVDPQPSDSPRIYTSADLDVAPPVAQTQRIPPWIPHSPRHSGAGISRHAWNC